MKLAIIGLPQSGKTTLFNALSGQNAAVGDYSRAEHRAVVKVPDQRVENLAQLENSKKITHAEIEFFDSAGFTGQGKENAGELVSAHDLRLVDALVMIINCFAEPFDPGKEMQTLVDEMVLADLMVIENNVEKLDHLIRVTGRRERQRELEILMQCREALNEGKLLAQLGLSDEDEKIIRGYAFLSLKPQIVVLNIAEDALDQAGTLTEKLAIHRLDKIREIVAVCGKLEMELAQLSDSEKNDFLKELNLEKPALERFLQASYGLLGLISFLTVGPPESRAWTIKKGTNAHRAAGAIHSDIERGFIKAEVASYEDYIVYKNLAALKAAARLHMEGKDYIVKDGDVILFRFNV